MTPKTTPTGEPVGADTFILCEYRRDLRQMWYVAARPGYMRCKDGTYARDGSFKGGPEWTTKREHALVFKSRLAAARVRSKTIGAVIKPA